MSKKTLILCFNKEQALQLMLDTDSADDFMDNINELDKYYIPRYVAETSKELIHPIPYFAVQDQEGKILLYQRGKGVGESRLLGNHSIGFGGHVELEKDGIELYELLKVKHTIQSAFENESHEELSATYLNGSEDLEFQDIKFIDIIYDESDEVGKVHLGIASCIQVKNATINEPELINCGWHTKEEIQDMVDLGKINLENWSKNLLKLL